AAAATDQVREERRVAPVVARVRGDARDLEEGVDVLAGQLLVDAELHGDPLQPFAHAIDSRRPARFPRPRLEAWAAARAQSGGVAHSSGSGASASIVAMSR